MGVETHIIADIIYDLEFVTKKRVRWFLLLMQ